jgi:PAS domain S-box-containing protein
MAFAAASGCQHPRRGPKLTHHELGELNRKLERRVRERTGKLEEEIAERRHAEEALRAREARERALLKAIPDLILVQDRQGVYLDYYAPDPKMLIMPPEQFLGKSMREVLPAELAARFEAVYARAHESGEMQRAEYSLAVGGTERHFETRIASIEGDRLVSLVREVTDRKRAEADLRRSFRLLREAQERYARASQVAKVGLWDWDLATNEMYVGPELKALLGFADQEIANRLEDWRGRIHPDDRERVMQAAESHLKEEVPQYEVEYRMLHKDGSVRWFLSRGVATRDAEGKAVRMVGADLDVTERHTLEVRLQQVHKMEAIGRLAGGIAHDFNNILGVILGHGQIVLSRLPANDSLRGRIETILAAADRAAGLTRQLLAFSRKQTIEPRVLDLNVLIAELSEILRRLVGEDIEVAFKPDRTLGRVRADHSQIEQVVINLAANARDAMPDGGRLLLETHNSELDGGYAREHAGARPGRYVALMVSDTGCGMSKEVLSHLFEPFFTTKEPGKGTGLGLATVYGIVKQSGGSIYAYSELGHGSTFKVYLPRVDAAVERRTVSAPRRFQGSETVLVVEDEDSLREITRELLESNGYRVLVAKDGPAALEGAERFGGAIHLLLTDVVMPGINGRELARRLQARRPSLRVLYMSGYTDDAIARHGVLEPGTLLLSKPFTEELLTRRVREALDVETRS